MDVRILAPDGNEYEALPKQEEFHGSSAKFRAYVGGFGSGKTLSGVIEALLLSLEFPGNVGLVGRRSYKELKATTQMEFLRICPKELIAEHNKSDGIVTLRNGSKIFFWNLQDADTFKSLNLGWFYIDEASEVQEEIFTILKGRLRLKTSSDGQQIRRCGYLTTNPNGHDWVWKLFVDKQNQAYYRRNYQLVHAPTKENKYLPADYIRDLEETYPAEWLARFMEGSFDVFEGQVYPALSDLMHKVPHRALGLVLDYIRPLAKMRAIDHGYTNPTVCLWSAIDYFGNVFFYREYRASKKTIRENCAEIRRLSEGEEYLRTLIDPSTRNKTGQGDGRSFYEEYHENGVQAQYANNQIKAGILRTSEYLRVREDHTNPLTGLAPSPMVFFLPGTEPTFEELRQLRWQKLKPGQERNTPEEPIDRDDHGPDCVRYTLMDRPMPSRQEVAASEYERMLQFVNAISAGREEDYDLPRIGGQSGPMKIELPNGQVIVLER